MKRSRRDFALAVALLAIAGPLELVRSSATAIAQSPPAGIDRPAVDSIYSIDSKLSPARTADARQRLAATPSLFDQLIRPPTRDRKAGAVDARDVARARPIPVVLFQADEAGTPPEEYLKSGGLSGSSGYFDGVRLLVCVGPLQDDAAWRVLQHEAFHAYLRYRFIDLGGGGEAAGRLLPPWLEEGLAEYAGEAAFGGDIYYPGALHPSRVEQIIGHIRARRFIPLGDLMRTQRPAWNAALGDVYYDQAFAVIHYLMQAESQRHAVAVSRLIEGYLVDDAEIRRDALQSLGPIDSLERRVSNWWLSQPRDPTPEIYAAADLRLIARELATPVGATSRPSRSFSKVDPLEAFAVIMQAQDAPLSPGEPSPNQPTTRPAAYPSATRMAMQRAASAGVWEWLPTRRRDSYAIKLTLPDGCEVASIWSATVEPQVIIDRLPRDVLRAQSLWSGGEAEAARDMLAKSIASHPRSVHLPAAREALRKLANTLPPKR